MKIGDLIVVIGGLLLLVLGNACLDLASKQVQGWLCDLPFVVLRVARRRLPAELRVTHHDNEFVPELTYIIFDKYANEPIVGLVKGFRFALGHVRGAKRLAREVERGRGGFFPARWELVARRAVDLTVVLAALLVLVIPMLIVALAIRLGTPGPALYRQQRIGQGGRPFTMYKFRTMRLGGSDAQHRELIARELRGEDTSVGGSWKIDSDPRVTRLGSILRRTSADELPGLLNVLRGQMSLVGPRPCLAWEAEMFPAEFAERFDAQPGLIGFSEAIAGGILEMLELDLAYVRSWSFWSYLRFLVRTIFALLRGRRLRIEGIDGYPVVR